MTTNTLNLKVDGMTCAHCARAVEKALKGVEGVAAAEADYASGSVTIGYSGKRPSHEALEPAVRKGGYTLIKEEEAAIRDVATDARREQRRSLILLILGVVLVAPVMVFHFAHLHGVAWDYAALALAVAIQATVGFDFYKGAVAGIRNLNLGMDVLVSIGMASGLIYGAGIVIFGWPTAPGLDKHVYFEAATLLVVFLRLGKYVEARARGNALGALRSLLQLAPEQARVKRDSELVTVPASEVKLGDICVVNAGGRIPVDGEVAIGEADVDEAMLTGEPVPVARRPGDTVRAGTIATNGSLEIRATAVGRDTTLASIVKLVEEAQRTKAPIQRFADKVSNYFVPAVVGIAVVTAVAWLIAGFGTGRAITHAIAVLVIACPCALGIAVPAAVMIGSGAALKRNILVKNGAALERISRATIFAFDKTGTLTVGKPSVQVVDFADGITERDVLIALEQVLGHSTHPFGSAAQDWVAKTRSVIESRIDGVCVSSPSAAFAEAIVCPKCGADVTVKDGSDITSCRYCGATLFISLPADGKGTVPPPAKVTEHAGKGLLVDSNGQQYTFGTEALIGDVPDAVKVKAAALRARGDSVSLLAVDGKVLAAFGFADSIREEAKAVIAGLHASGARTVLITGDHQTAAEHVARELGIEEVHAGISPAGKLELIDTLKQQGVTAMVGDGINDAPALARADIGVAIGGGSDVAKETGDLVLMSGKLSDLPIAIDFGRRSLRAIYQNLFLSLVYNAIGIPLAAGALVWAGVFLPPSYAALAMVFSDVSVAINSARLARELRRSRNREGAAGVAEST